MATEESDRSRATGFVVALCLLLVGMCLVFASEWMAHEYHFYPGEQNAAANAAMARDAFVRLGGGFCILLGVWLMERTRAGGGNRRLRWAMVLVTFVLLFLWSAQHSMTTVYEKPLWRQGISHGRQVAIALKAYASDHDGKYPDAAPSHPTNSNDAMRQLFIEGILLDERQFGCPHSAQKPDGVIGKEPDFAEALKPGENHWAMTKGLLDSSPPEMPLIFESPAVATWPPKWNANAVEVEQPGRVWRGGRVIVGLNDGSVSMMPLESTQGSAVGLAPKADGSPVFPDVHPTPEILDIQK